MFNSSPRENRARLKRLSDAATPGPWASIRNGNQYVNTGYLPSATLVGASVLSPLQQPWNPYAEIAFGITGEGREVVRLTDEDADFIVAAVEYVREMLRYQEAN